MPKRLLVCLLHTSAFILLVSSAAPLAGTATLAPAPTSASDNPTAGAIRHATQEAAATRAARATLTQMAATERAGQTQTAQAAARASATAGARATLEAVATGQAVLAAKGAWPQRLLETFADNHLAWPLGLTADHSLSVTSTIDAGHYHW